MRWKMHELTFQGHENKDFRFHGVNISHEISMKSLAGYYVNHKKFTKPWIWIFMGHEI